MRTLASLPAPVPVWSGGLFLLALLMAAAPGMADPWPEPGAQGYGLSVFQGDTPERFEVEILGTLRGWGGTGDMILARLSGASLEHTGVLQGMSGSPVYIDGELIGAVMNTWAFAKDPIAGIRPIGEMRELSDYLESGAHPGWRPGDPRVDASTLGADPGIATLDSVGRPTPVAPPGWEGAQSMPGLLWTATGLPASLRPELERVLGAPVQAAAGGGSTGSEGGTLEPGDAMAALLIDGDARLASVGTVTAREGDTILGYGHPFLGAGPVGLPMARARVVALLASDQISFKLAEATQTVGSILVDRRAGVSGRLGVVADTLPVSVTWEDRTYRFQVARMEGLLPNLVSWCAMAALVDREEPRPSSTLGVSVQLDLEGEAPIKVEAALTGGGVGTGLAREVAWPVALVRNNRARAVRIESVRIDLDLDPTPRAARLGQVRITPTQPRAGDRLRIRAEVLPQREEPRWVELELQIPRHTPPGPLRLHVLDGGGAFREELSRATPRWGYPGFDQIQDALSLRHPASTLVATLYAPPQSVVVRGTELERLPPSVREVMTRSGAKDGTNTVGATPLAQATVPTGWVLQAARRVTLDLLPPRQP